jgi:hypothetical protein
VGLLGAIKNRYIKKQQAPAATVPAKDANGAYPITGRLKQALSGFQCDYNAEDDDDDLGDINSYSKGVVRTYRHAHESFEHGSRQREDQFDKDVAEIERQHLPEVAEVNKQLVAAGYKPTAILEIGEKGHATIYVNIEPAAVPVEAPTPEAAPAAPAATGNSNAMHEEMSKQLPTGHKIISSDKNKLVVSTGDGYSIIYETKKMPAGFNRLYVSVNDGEKVHEIVSMADPEKRDMARLVRNAIEDTSDEIAMIKRRKEAKAPSPKAAAKELKTILESSDFGYTEAGGNGRVKANADGTLTVFNGFYYGERQARENLKADWSPGGHNADYFAGTGYDVKVLGTDSELKSKVIKNGGHVSVTLAVTKKPPVAKSLQEEITSATMLLKSHVKTYTRRTKSGAVATVAEHDDSRQDHGHMRFEYKSGPNKDILHVSKDKIIAGGGPEQRVPMSLANYMFQHRDLGNGDASKKMKAEVRAAYDASGGDPAKVLEAIKTTTKTLNGWSLHSHDKPMKKSHVKTYQRTTASGASVTVKEHDDSRQKMTGHVKTHGLTVKDKRQEATESAKDAHFEAVDNPSAETHRHAYNAAMHARDLHEEHGEHEDAFEFERIANAHRRHI